MAVSTTTLDAITFKHVLSNMPEDGIYNTRPALKRFVEKCKTPVPGGKTITQTIYTSTNSNTGFYAPSDARDFTVQDNVRDIELNWKYARGTGTLLEADILKNKGSKEKIVDLLTTQVFQMREDVATTLETGIFGAGTDSSGLALDGFGSVFEANAPASQTGTYAGVARTNSWWQHKYVNHAGLMSPNTSITKDQLNTYINDAWGVNMGDDARKPTVMWTDFPVYETIWNEYSASQRLYVNEDDVNYGVDSFRFRGIPIFVSQGLTEGTGADSKMYILNENYWKFCCHPDRDMKFGSWKQLEDGELITADYLWMGNLVCTNPRFQMYVNNIVTD